MHHQTSADVWFQLQLYTAVKWPHEITERCINWRLTFPDIKLLPQLWESRQNFRDCGWQWISIQSFLNVKQIPQLPDVFQSKLSCSNLIMSWIWSLPSINITTEIQKAFLPKAHFWRCVIYPSLTGIFTGANSITMQHKSISETLLKHLQAVSWRYVLCVLTNGSEVRQSFPFVGQNQRFPLHSTRAAVLFGTSRTG